MTASSTTRESALQREQRLFNELSSHLIAALLNKIFDLRPEKASRRSFYISILFLFVGLFASLIYYPLPIWAERIGNVFTSMLSTSSSTEQANTAISDLFLFFWGILKDPRILQYLPVFIAPFFIALQSAAIYLADVFELEDVNVARQFISGVALSGSDQTIRVKQGSIAEEHMETPTFLIGGPGKVVVELDSVALFERADGTPHVIGPTGKEPGGKATIEGFERFRQALDIRDHYVDLRDQDSKSKAVQSRSRDGIPINATDVRLVFSVYRGENPVASPECPYQFSKEAVEQIVFKAASRVTPELPNPSTFEFTWINKMIGLIRGRLGGFMSQHNLTDYLASIGMPEVEKTKQREDKIFAQMQELTQSGDDPSERKEVKAPPDFQSRYKIKNLFAQFAEGFSSQARGSGVELHWIGVGTWESPVDIVPEKHLEAWLLTQENLKNDSTEQMNRIEHGEIVEKMKELIQKVPLAPYESIINSYRHAKKRAKQSSYKKKEDYSFDDDEDEGDFAPKDGDEQYAEVLGILQNMQEENADEKVDETDHENNMKGLLLEYRKQFMETVDFIKAKKESVPQNLLDAVKHIENQIGHWAGRL